MYSSDKRERKPSSIRMYCESGSGGSDDDKSSSGFVPSDMESDDTSFHSGNEESETMTIGSDEMVTAVSGPIADNEYQRQERSRKRELEATQQQESKSLPYDIPNDIFVTKEDGRGDKHQSTFMILPLERQWSSILEDKLREMILVLKKRRQ